MTPAVGPHPTISGLRVFNGLEPESLSRPTMGWLVM